MTILFGVLATSAFLCLLLLATFGLAVFNATRRVDLDAPFPGLK